MNKIINIEYSAIQGSYWMVYGAIYSFASVFLLAKDYSNSEIGIIFAVANVLAVVLQPVIADFADRTRKISIIGISQAMTIMLMFASVGLFAFQKKTLALSVIFVFLIAWHSVLQPLFNSLSFKLGEVGLKASFGLARGMGSLCYSAFVAVLGFVVERLGVGILPITAEVVMAMMLLSLLIIKLHYDKTKKNRMQLDDLKVEAAEISETSEISLIEFIARNKMFFVVNIGVLGVYFSNATLNNYTMQIIAAVDGNSEDLGRVLSLMAFLEIPTMVLFNKLRERFTCQSMLKLASLGFAVKMTIIYLAKSMVLIYAAQFLQLVSFALFLPAMVHFINEIMSPGEAVRGQALYTMTVTVTTVIASLAGGVILDVSGAKMLSLIATVISLVGAIIIVFSIDKVKEK